MNPLTIENITGIIVSFNEKNLLVNSYTSIRRAYPTLPIIIIDGSHLHHPCYKTAQGFISKITRVISVHFNIGHGKGMKLGIDLCRTDYFLLIDSDTRLQHPPLLDMMEKMNESTYGIGELVKVDRKGLNSPSGEIPYLHPYFALLNKHRYNNFKPIIHHGAPMIRAMLHLHDSGSGSYLKDFPVNEYIRHLGRGTRQSSPEGFHPKTWDKIKA